MTNGLVDRRGFIAGLACAAASTPVAGRAAGKLHVSCASYSWEQFYARDGRNFTAALSDGLADVARSGLDGYESNIPAPGDLDRLLPLLKRHGLGFRSLYVNTELHRAETAGEAIRRAVEIARKAKADAGTQIVVTNPSPLPQGPKPDKDDAQLSFQADRLNVLGAELRRIGVTLAYHTHAVEMRMAAREFHHMLLSTDPANVGLCLDVHWIYRGCGNSSVALFDIMKLYGDRIRELHLRQSSGGVWTEVFGPGDIDYTAVAAGIARLKIRPHLVLEQAPEPGTPRTLGPVELHKASREYVDKVFAALA
jgi:inosose dehydratase